MDTKHTAGSKLDTLGPYCSTHLVATSYTAARSQKMKGTWMVLMQLIHANWMCRANSSACSYQPLWTAVRDRASSGH
jgi:hypothetical protein